MSVLWWGSPQASGQATHRSLPGLVQARCIREQAQNKTGDNVIIMQSSQKTKQNKTLCLTLKCETSRGGCRF